MIQVIHRALNILEFLSKEPNREFGLSEITAAVDLNAGTCANILKTLVQRNYVEQHGAKKGYKLGFMFFQLTQDSSYNTNLVNLIKPTIEDLRMEINETIIFSIIRGHKRVLLYESQCAHEVQVRTTSESSIYRATTARVILSHYSPHELNDFIDTVGLPTEDEWPEVKDKSDLLRLLNDIRVNNIEVTSNKNHVVSLATPIVKGGRVVASLGVYLPDIRFGKVEKSNIIKQLKRATDLINEELNSTVVLTQK